MVARHFLSQPCAIDNRHAISSNVNAAAERDDLVCLTQARESGKTFASRAVFELSRAALGDPPGPSTIEAFCITSSEGA